MAHGVKKIKIKSGKDANRMLMRKLTVNFISHGTMVTTEKKAKTLRPFIERLVEKAKTKSEANHNYLLRVFTVKKFMSIMVDQVGPALQDKHGGYIRLTRLNQRDSDGAIMTRVEWAHPVVLATEEVKPARTKEVTATSEVKETKKEVTKKGKS